MWLRMYSACAWSFSFFTAVALLRATAMARARVPARVPSLVQSSSPVTSSLPTNQSLPSRATGEENRPAPRVAIGAIWTVPDAWSSTGHTWCGDFNGDGKADIASASRSTSRR